MIRPLHAIGQALGATPGECECAVCGRSAFAPGRRARDVFGPAFTDYDLCASDAPDVCDGCARILGGKPGSDPPPLRMSSFAVVDGELERLGIDELCATLRGRPGVQAVGWAVSRQKHASLRCGPCSPALYRIGCDHGTIDWRPHEDAPLLDAVAQLRQVARREQILSGEYPPHVIQALGRLWAPAEDIVAGYRASLHLVLAVAIVRRPDITEESPAMQIPPEYEAAARLLLPLTQHSALRTEDPIRFWSSTLPRRLAAAATCGSVIEWISHLCESLRVATFHPDVVDLLSMHIDDAAVLAVLRRDHRLLITFTRALRAEDF